MSDTKRYKLRPIFWDYTQKKSVSREQIDAMGNESAYSHKDGDWVKYEDYARLQAEVERLTQLNDTLSMRYDSAWALINVQTNYIERLTKAGDAMAVKINVHGINDRFTDSQKLVDDWSNAAKGVQS